MTKNTLDPIFAIRETADEILNQEKPKECKNEFEISGTLNEVSPLSKTTSTVTILTDKGTVELKNNKTAEFWERSKTLYGDAIIKGFWPFDRERGIARIYAVKSWFQEEIRKKCSEEELKLLSEVSGKLDARYIDQVIAMSRKTKDRSQREEAAHTPIAYTYHEMVAVYLFMKKKFPAQVREWMYSYIEKYQKAGNDEKERILKKMYFPVNYYRGIPEQMHLTSPCEARRRLDSLFPGQSHIKDMICQKYAIFQRNPNHVAPKILLHASSRYDLVGLVESFFKICGIPYDIHSVSGCTDPSNMQGCSAVYNNASLGSLALKLAAKGEGGIIMKDIDAYGSSEGVMPLASMMDGQYYNELLDHPIDLQCEYIFFTARDLDKIPFDYSHATVIEPVDFSDEEMLGHFDRILNDFCVTHNLSNDFFRFDMDAKRKIVFGFVSKNDIKGMKGIINEICGNALLAHECDDSVNISLGNIDHFFSLLVEKPHLDKDHLETVEEIRKKMIVSSETIASCLRDRVSMLLEEHEHEQDEAKKKILEKKIIALGNIRGKVRKTLDLEGVESELRYLRGMNGTKAKILDDLYAVEKGVNKRMSPKILVGPPGLAKLHFVMSLEEDWGYRS